MTSAERRRRKGDNQSVFVTVGTTKFDKLIETVCSKAVLEKLRYLGYKKLTLQIGGGDCVPDVSVDQIPGLDLEYFKYKPSIKEDIIAADLVISHAGAGSVLESLGAVKSLLVVINDDLMGNHQLELAYQLSNDGHLYYCNCSNLLETLSTADFSKLKPFKPGQPELFAQYLDKLMGFSR